MSAAIAVIGGGAWGTALAISLSARGLRVRLWIREPELLSRMRERRDNPAHLPGIDVPTGVVPSGDLGEILDGVELAIVAVPSPFARRVYEAARPVVPAGLPLVLAMKGIEEATLALPMQVAADVIGGERPMAVLSGPSFAAEVARGLPTAIAAASASPAFARKVQDVLSGRGLRVYTNDDPVGVQLAGALKNVIAIAAGAADGLGMGHSAIAALITRGLGEIRRLGVAAGARAETFYGLAGMGDLVLTCTGDLSRNRHVGRALGRGERLRDVLAHMSGVAEGVRTASSASELARRHDVAMPIVDEVVRLLSDEGAARDAVARLLARPLTSEEPTRAESLE